MEWTAPEDEINAVLDRLNEASTAADTEAYFGLFTPDARFIGTERPAKVAMIAGSLSYRAHEEREAGFLHVFSEMAPGIEIVGLREGHDDEALNYRQTRMLLATHPDLAGIYNIGGGAAGIARALKEARRERAVVFVGHGLTPDTRAQLLDGTMDAVITQDPHRSILDCVRIFENILCLMRRA